MQHPASTFTRYPTPCEHIHTLSNTCKHIPTLSNTLQAHPHVIQHPASTFARYSTPCKHIHTLSNTLQAHSQVIQHPAGTFRSFNTLHAHAHVIQHLVPHETAAVAARSVYTIQPCTIPLCTSPLSSLASCHQPLPRAHRRLVDFRNTHCGATTTSAFRVVSY